jgi:DNA-directed RNA polymerase subunit RPC12/RpoP
MGTLVFVCPTTGHEVSSGIEIDRSSFKSLPRTKTPISCPHCREKHLLSAIWAWLVSEYPEVPPKGEPIKSAA